MANQKPMTLAEARTLLYEHATDDPSDTDGTFRKRLNEVIERIYGDGLWDACVSREDITGMISDHILTLDYEWEAMIAVAVEESPKDIMDEGHEFTQGGPGTQDAGEGGNLVVDLGFNEVSGKDLRQYKFLMSINAGDTVEGLLKRRFAHLVHDSDVIRPANIGALKHGLLAICFENEGDPQRSQAYWNICYDILNKEKATNNIGVTRTRPTQPWGFQTQGPTNIM